MRKPNTYISCKSFPITAQQLSHFVIIDNSDYMPNLYY